jgi:hypothetical protein
MHATAPACRIHAPRRTSFALASPPHSKSFSSSIACSVNARTLPDACQCR